MLKRNDLNGIHNDEIFKKHAEDSYIISPKFVVK